MTHQYCTLYRARNLVNGKEYYGIAVDPKRRWSRHKRSAFSNNPAEGFALARAIKKHGADAFEFSVLMEERGDDAVTKCKDAEMLVIEMANSQVPNGYNITAGGDGANGCVFTDEHRKKIGAAHAGKAVSEATRKKLSVAQTGKVVSEATRKKLSAAHTGKVLSEATRKKVGAAHAGKVASEESRKRMSAAHTGKVVSEETRKRMSAAQTGKVMSDEARKKIGAAQIGRTHSEETRKKISDAKKGSPASVERMKAVLCSNTMQFISGRSATEWLRKNGHPKASVSAISNAASGKVKSAYGYTWKFIEKEMA